jgi:hypothetical protein
MEHEAMRPIVRALEKLGARPDGDHCLVPCQRCNRHRRFDALAIPSLKVMRFLFCNECMRQMQLAPVIVGPNQEIIA